MFLVIEKYGPTTGPVVLRQGEPGTSQYICENVMNGPSQYELCCEVDTYMQCFQYKHLKSRHHYIIQTHRPISWIGNGHSLLQHGLTHSVPNSRRLCISR